MESERIMRKWAQRRGWDEWTKKTLVYAFIDELGPDLLNKLDRYLAKTAAGKDDAVATDGT